MNEQTRFLNVGRKPTPIPPMDGRSAAVAFMDEHEELQRELVQCKTINERLRMENGSLVAENGVLREQLDRADSDRVRLQAVAGTLMGRLLAINDTIGGAVRAAIKDGIEAAAIHDRQENVAEQDQKPEESEPMDEEPEQAPAPVAERPRAALAAVRWEQ